MNYIFCGCDTVSLAKEFGSPLYVMSEDIILDKINIVKNCFDLKYENAKSYYASKAFLTKDMLRILKNTNIGLDVVSGGELYCAIQNDFPPSDIIFHGNAKTYEEIQMAIQYNVGRFVCDSIFEINLINDIAKKFGKKVNILIRITPGIDSHTHKYISTASYDSKFGVPISELYKNLENIIALENVILKGFHFHVGSQLLVNTSHIMALNVLLKIIQNVYLKNNFITKELNFGGGFGIRYTSDDKPNNLEHFIDPMVQTVQNFCKNNSLYTPKLMIEPGRFIVGEAGITLYTVTNIKDIPTIKKYISIDGGFCDNPRPALYQAIYDAVVANKSDQPWSEIVTLAGKCCESGDILINNLKVPNVEVGDIIAVKSTGAYNYSMSSNYNKNCIPAVVMINNKIPRLSVKRQTYDQLYERDI